VLDATIMKRIHDLRFTIYVPSGRLTLKPLAIFIIAILFATTAGPIAQGQTRRRRVPTPRTRKTKPPTPVKEDLTTPGMTKTPSGLIYVVTKRSTGQLPKAGQIVAVNYTGLLGTGVKFDSSLDRGQPIKFPLGRGRVIKGWDEGIAKLRVGEQATLIIPPDLGYGAKGAGDVIPPDATLIFIVELMAVVEAPTSN
jgi:peptidylprolyl isomerase